MIALNVACLFLSLMILYVCLRMYLVFLDVLETWQQERAEEPSKKPASAGELLMDEYDKLRVSNFSPKKVR